MSPTEEDRGNACDRGGPPVSTIFAAGPVSGTTAAQVPPTARCGSPRTRNQGFAPREETPLAIGTSRSGRRLLHPETAGPTPGTPFRSHEDLAGRHLVKTQETSRSHVLENRRSRAPPTGDLFPIDI